MEKVDLINDEKKLNRILSDAGSGSIGIGFKAEPTKFHCVAHKFLQCTCTLHDISLILCNAVTKSIGKSGISKNTPL